jgi:RimK family alpha-L-glutamate ligase
VTSVSRRVAIVAHSSVESNGPLAAGWSRLGLDASVVSPAEALGRLRCGDVALIRLDVRRTLDGCEGGLEVVPDLRLAGVRILNPPAALLAAHDKLWTEQRLGEAGLRRPSTAHVLHPDDPVELEPPYVVKPRFGSWGEDVELCETRDALRTYLTARRDRPWFRAHGALVQQLLTRERRDVRVVVAGGAVIGAAARLAAPGEWRTNISQGGSLAAVTLDAGQRQLAISAVAALGGDLMGADLVDTGAGDVVLEVNGAVDFDERYALPGSDIYADAAAALGLLTREGPRDGGPSARVATTFRSEP